MTLTKKKGVYYANIRTPEGNTRSISTRCKNLDDAKAVVKEANVRQLEIAARAGRLTNEVIGRLTVGRKLSVDKALKQYLAHLESIGKAPKTIHNHLTTLTKWIEDAKVSHLAPASIDEKHISDWINTDAPSAAVSCPARPGPNPNP